MMEMKWPHACLTEILGGALQVAVLASLLAMAPGSRGAELAPQLRESAQALYGNELERAASLARSYVKLHPQDPAGLVLPARAEMAQGKYQPAYQELLRALRADPRNIDTLYYLAQVSKTLGLLEYQHLFAMAPDSARAHQFVAESYVAQKNDAKADPRSVEILCALGDAERWLLRFDDAVEHYSRALELAPNDNCAVYGIGVAHLRRHELPRAIEYFRRAVVLQPTSGETRLALGSALLQSGNVTGALSELKSAVAYKPDLRQAYALLARAFRLLGQQEEAEEALKKARQLEQREREYVHRPLVWDDLSLAPSSEFVVLALTFSEVMQQPTV